ncbi:unnamed protein product [Merluccius merluccius]
MSDCGVRGGGGGGGGRSLDGRTILDLKLSLDPNPKTGRLGSHSHKSEKLVSLGSQVPLGSLGSQVFLGSQVSLGSQDPPATCSEI